MQIFNVTYGVWKTIYNANTNWSIYQYSVDSDEKETWTGNSEFIYHTIIDSSQYPDYSSSLEGLATPVSSSDDAVASIIGLGQIKSPFQEDNALRVTTVGRKGDEFIFTTHNYSDKTTWFSEAQPVVTESLSNSGDNLTFSGSQQYWIDMEHGKVHREHVWNTDDKYSVVVTVDDVEKTKRLNWDTSGGDYTVNYASASITFFEEVTGSVKASYYYADGSAWILKPDAGKQIEIEDAEAQFSSDVLYEDGILFEVKGPIDIFAPQLLISNGGPYPAGTLITVDNDEFKTMHQIIDEAKGAYPKIPALGGSRGMTQEMHGFPFRYGTVRTLKNSLGLELHVSLTNDQGFGGERATATFFTIIEDDS